MVLAAAVAPDSATATADMAALEVITNLIQMTQILINLNLPQLTNKQLTNFLEVTEVYRRTMDTATTITMDNEISAMDIIAAPIRTVFCPHHVKPIFIQAPVIEDTIDFRFQLLICI